MEFATLYGTYTKTLMNYTVESFEERAYVGAEGEMIARRRVA